MPKPISCLSRNARIYLAKHENGEMLMHFGPLEARLWKVLASQILNDSPKWEYSESKPLYLLEKIDILNIYGQPAVRKVDCWLYKNRLYFQDDDFDYSSEQWMLLVHDEFDKERKQFEKMQANFSASTKASLTRSKIPSNVRIFVWQRDGGRCVECSSNESLEYDHIIPFAKGGSNTERNLQLLCGNCNRLKSDNIQ